MPRWQPITDLPEGWEKLRSSHLEGLLAIWRERYEKLKDSTALAEFNARLQREWAIETGIIEGLQPPARIGLVRFRGMFSLAVCLTALLGFNTGKSAFAQAKEEDKEKAAAKTCYTFPFEYAPPLQPFLIVKAKIGDSEPLDFMLDTGSSGFSVYVAPSVVARLGLRHRDTSKKSTETGTESNFRPIEDFSFTLVGKTADDDAIIEAESAVTSKQSILGEYPSTRGLAGIISVSLFENLVGQLDFSKRELRISEDANLLSKNRSVANVLPITFNRNGQPTVQISYPNNRTEQHLLDTGASGMSVSESLSNDLKTGKFYRGSLLTAGGLQEGSQFVLSSIKVGNISIENVVCSQTSAKSGTKSNPKLGVDVLSLFIVTIDIANSRLILEPRRDIIPFSPNAIGMNRFRVTRNAANKVIIQSSAGSEFDKLVGMEITKIDGMEVKGLTVGEVQGLVEGRAGKIGRVSGFHNAKPIEFSFMRKSWLTYLRDMDERPEN
jgi:predicted aspartyl protease